MQDLERFRTVAYSSYGRGPAAQPRTASSRAAENPYLRAVVKNTFPANREAVVLDLGCGYGDLLRVASGAGYRRLKGVDQAIDPVAAATASQLGIELVAADIRTFLEAVPSESVDFVVTFDVMEHLQREEALEMSVRVHRILRRGGQWLLHVPNAQSPLFGRIRYGDITHELVFTRDSLSQLLRLTGFSSFRFLEDAPVIHGLRSALRFIGWKAIRSLLRFYLAVETGRSGANEVFTQGMLAIATRSDEAFPSESSFATS